jgi:hypothetical protein
LKVLSRNKSPSISKLFKTSKAQSGFFLLLTKQYHNVIKTQSFLLDLESSSISNVSKVAKAQSLLLAFRLKHSANSDLTFILIKRYQPYPISFYILKY